MPCLFLWETNSSFDEEVSPFAAEIWKTQKMGSLLVGSCHRQEKMQTLLLKFWLPVGWKILADIAGLQFILEDYKKLRQSTRTTSCTVFIGTNIKNGQANNAAN